MKRSKKQQNGQWQKTPVSNLVRNATSGAYYARVRVAGKLIWKSLKTDRITVAQLRLGDFLKQERRRAEAAESGGRGKITFEQALKTYEQRLDGDVSLKPRSKEYRRERIKALLKSWPELKSTDVRHISKAECLEWAGRFAKQASPSNFNNTVGTFRLILDVALEAGARYDNPARHIKRVRVRQKHLQLPSHENFLKLVDIIRKADGGYGDRCGDLVEFLAYSGCRKGEAARVHGRDCNFEKGELTVLGDPATGTKNWEIRRVPMIPDMRRLLERIKSEREDFAGGLVNRRRQQNRHCEQEPKPHEPVFLHKDSRGIESRTCDSRRSISRQGGFGLTQLLIDLAHTSVSVWECWRTCDRLECGAIIGKSLGEFRLLLFGAGLALLGRVVAVLDVLNEGHAGCMVDFFVRRRQVAVEANQHSGQFLNF